MEPELKNGDVLIGNAAKYYVQKKVGALLDARPWTVIVDLGCGDAQKWDWLYNSPLAEKVEFVGCDPDERTIGVAAQMKPRWKFFAEPAYCISDRVRRADIVVSFSTLEHVYQRRRFLESAKSLMHDGTLFFLNYDNGHFFGWAEWKRNLFGPILARLGHERYYQSFVSQAEIEGLLQHMDLRIVEELNFHQATSKTFHRVLSVPGLQRKYMDLWLDFELGVNHLLREDSRAWAEANSNRYLLSKLFVLALGPRTPS